MDHSGRRERPDISRSADGFPCHVQELAIAPPNGPELGDSGPTSGFDVGPPKGTRPMQSP